MNYTPRYYAIDNWRQATNCTSNIDRSLKIQYTQFVNSHVLEGGRIQVVHPEFGVVFAAFTAASGTLVDYDADAFLSTEEILKGLRQLGFDIRFKTNPVINQATRDYLQAALALGYTTVRWVVKKHRIQVNSTCFQGNCRKHGCAEGHTHVVVLFDENKCPELLRQYPPPIKNFGGDIMEVDMIKNTALDFSWLILPMNIQSILNPDTNRKEDI